MLRDLSKSISMGVSIHAPREGCDSIVSCNLTDIIVSIHAPREGCDAADVRGVAIIICFNSRTPGGVRLSVSAPLAKVPEFQFTHPGRGATLVATASLDRLKRFNSRTPGGVRLANRQDKAPKPKFQFTHPGRGATADTYSSRGCNRVSIHAPREGCDLSITSSISLPRYVSIHAPREGCDY